MRDNVSPDHIDEIIDDVARSMTRAEPSPLLRTAVRARLEPPRSAPASWRVVLATAAVVVAAIAGRALLDVPDPPSAPPEIELRAALPPAPVEPAPLTVSVPPAPSGSRAARASESRASATRSVAPAPVLAGPLPAGDEIVVVEPISEDPLDELPVEVELMETPMPLRAEWVEIEPLSIQ